MDLRDKHVIYVGGFGGIGQKCLPELLAKGVKKLCVFDLKEQPSVLQALRRSYSEAIVHFMQLDITDKENILAAYKKAADAMDGRIDVVVNGCGLMDERYIEASIQINLLGVIHSTLTAIKYMDKSNGGAGGTIVNIASVVGLQPAGMFAVYSGAKSGVLAFTRALAQPYYYDKQGISFVSICPGFTDTALLDDPELCETFPCENSVLAKRFHMAERQKPEECAKNIIKTIEIAKNGAVWMLDLGDMKEIEFPVFWKPTAKKE